MRLLQYSFRLLRSSYGSITIISLLFVVILSSCSSSTTPEEQIQEYIERAEVAIEGKDTGDIKDLISADYSDRYKNNRQDVVRILAGYFLRRPSIHLLSTIDEISLDANKSTATITIYAAVSKVAVDKNDLNLLDASFYHLKAKLVHDSDWLLKSAELQRVSADSFLSAIK